MVSGSSIATLVVFILSIICVINPWSFTILLPYMGRKRVPINLKTAPIIAILVLWAAQCLGPHEIRDGIVGTDGIKPYNILILFFSLAYMAITLDISGVLRSAAFWVTNRGGSNGRKLFLYLYLLLTVISVFLGSEPVILTGTVFLVYYTRVNELNPAPWLISEFAAANTASMVFFVGNPTNVVICEGFAVNNAGFTAYTVLPFLACSLTCFIALAIQFRDVKYIPQKLDVSGDLDVRAVLRDPVGASVGGALLGTCLIVIIVLSFSNVQVWMISLPFAVSKLLWDLAWDTYRLRYLKMSALEGENEKSSMDDGIMRRLKRRKTDATIITEESGILHKLKAANANAVAVSELKRRETHATITKEESDLKHEFKVEIASAVVEDEEDDVMLRELKRWKTRATITTEMSDFKHKLKIEIANAVANGAANGRVDTVPNILEPIKMLSPTNTNTDPIANAVANGAANVVSSLAANRRIDTVPNTVEPIRMLSPANTDAIANAVANGAANRRVLNTVELIGLGTLSPANTNTDPIANAVANGAANGRVPNAVEPIRILSPANTVIFDEPLPPLSQQRPSTPPNSKPFSSRPILSSISDLLHRFSTYLSIHFPTFHTALPRLPFALVPFAFSQFILIEGLSRQGWIDVFAEWLVIATKREMFTTVWVVGILGVLLCNTSGTNIGATILLTKIVNTAALTYVPPSSGPEVNIKAFLRSAAIALAVASNIGAVSFTFSASLAGLLWRQILIQKYISIRQKTFAWWNLSLVLVMTAVGLAVVSAEMAVLY